MAFKNHFFFQKTKNSKKNHEKYFQKNFFPNEKFSKLFSKILMCGKKYFILQDFWKAIFQKMKSSKIDQ